MRLTWVYEKEEVLLLFLLVTFERSLQFQTFDAGASPARVLRRGHRLQAGAGQPRQPGRLVRLDRQLPVEDHRPGQDPESEAGSQGERGHRVRVQPLLRRLRRDHQQHGQSFGHRHTLRIF